MCDLLRNLDRSPESISDAEGEAVWNHYKKGMQADCAGASIAFLSALASICSRKPPMVEKLLGDALEPLLMWGFEDSSAIIQWASEFTKINEPYMGRPDDRAIRWIRESFVKTEGLIQHELETFEAGLE